MYVGLVAYTPFLISVMALSAFTFFTAPAYLELALTFYLYLNDMDGDYLDDHDYSREEILDGLKSLAEDWGVTGLETLV